MCVLLINRIDDALKAGLNSYLIADSILFAAVKDF